MAEIKGLDKLQRKLNTLEQFQRKLRKPMTESVAMMQDYIAKAPRKKKGAFSTMATDAQRRAYWAKVRSGEAGHREGIGYVRTSTLVRGWTHKVTMTSSGVRGEVGNSKAANYGTFVQGERQQSFHAASGWRTTEETIEKNIDKIQDKFEKVIKAELNK